MKLSKEECLSLGIAYVNKYSCYPAAKGWTIDSAGCSRDRIYSNWSSWPAFVEELSNLIDIPNKACSTASNTNKIYKLDKPCKLCGTLTFQRNTYCSTTCFNKSKYLDNVKKLLNGDFANSKLNTDATSWVRRYLTESKGLFCESCGIKDIYNGKPLLLEIDHINGRCYNNVITNLRFLCPNCHSQTSNYKAKNKNSDHIVRYKKV